MLVVETIAKVRRDLANNIECPACTHSWQAAESDLGLRQCSVCGADLEITRVPIAWSYDATEVAVVKADEAS